MTARERASDERQRPARMVMVVDEEDLHREDAVDERADDRVRERAAVRRVEAEDEDAVEGDRQVQRNASRPDQRWMRFTCSCGRRTTPWRWPKIRAAVSTWTSARSTAAVANHALPAIVDENTDVMMSV